MEDENEENNNEDEDEADQTNSSGHFKLRRRDTPHHLKGARLNSPKAQQLDPNEMKEILERYTSASSTNSSTRNPTSPKATNGTQDLSIVKLKVKLLSKTLKNSFIL